MAVDREATILSRVYSYYVMCNLPVSTVPHTGRIRVTIEDSMKKKSRCQA